MLRYVLAVVAGYAVMAVIVMAGFVPYFINQELVVQPGTLDVKMGFMIYILVVGFFGAMVGGWVCALISRSYRLVMILAGLAFIVGIGTAIHNYNKPRPTRSAEQIKTMTFNEIMEVGRQPDWYAFTLPFIAGIGILVGGRIKASGAA